MCAGKVGKAVLEADVPAKRSSHRLGVSSQGLARWDGREGAGERPQEGDLLGLSERWAMMWDRERCDSRNTMSSKCSYCLLGFPGWRTEPHEKRVRTLLGCNKM